MFARLSSEKIQYTTLCSFFVLALLVVALLVLQTSLTCVDEKGCLLEHCQSFRFKSEYRDIIDQSVSGNAQCLYSRQ